MLTLGHNSQPATYEQTMVKRALTMGVVAIAAIAAVAYGVRLHDTWDGPECSSTNNTVTITEYGTTLWDLARIVPGSAPSGEVEAVVQARNPTLDAVRLTVGQVVEIPSRCDQ